MPAIRLFIILAICATLIGFGHAAESALILNQLRANDAHFNNVSLTYTRTTDTRVAPDQFSYMKTGTDVSAMPENFWETRTVRNVYQCGLIVRGDDIVTSSALDAARSDKDKYVSFNTAYRGGQIDGIVYELHDLRLPAGDPGKNDPNYERQLHIKPWDHDLNFLHDTRLGVELAFGIGMGRRITAITSDRQTLGGREIAGTIQIWRDDVSTFTATLDATGLVRRAEIVSTFPGSHIWRFDIESEGTFELDGVLLAKAGSFTRTLTGQPEPTESYRVELAGIEFDLTEERFTALSAFSVQPLMQVNDRVTGIQGTGEMGPDGRVRVKTSTHEPRTWDARHAGHPAPTIETTLADGLPWQLADQRGKVVLLHFWATWCGPCLAELPELQNVYQAFAGREDFVMVGVSLDSTTDRLLAFCRRRSIDWPQLLEPGKKWDNSAARALEIKSLPALVLISRNGQIAPANFPIAELESRIQRLLNTKE